MKEIEPNREKLFHADEAFSAIGRALKDVSANNPFKENLEKVQDEIGKARRNLEFEVAPEFTFKEPSSEFEGKVKEQIDNLIQLGFQEELGMTEDEYRASFPKFANFSKIISKRSRRTYDQPLVVDTRLDPGQLLGRANIRTNIHDLEHIMSSDNSDEKRYKLKPTDMPYIAYLNSENKRVGFYSEYTGKDVVSYVSSESVEERSMNFYEAVAYIIQNPVFLDGERIGLSIPYTDYVEEDPDDGHKYNRTSMLGFESKLFSAKVSINYPYLI